jgi:hypothetical protein
VHHSPVGQAAGLITSGADHGIWGRGLFSAVAHSLRVNAPVHGCQQLPDISKCRPANNHLVHPLLYALPEWCVTVEVAALIESNPHGVPPLEQSLHQVGTETDICTWDEALVGSSRM